MQFNFSAAVAYSEVTVEVPTVTDYAPVTLQTSQNLLAGQLFWFA